MLKEIYNFENNIGAVLVWAESLGGFAVEQRIYKTAGSSRCKVYNCNTLATATARFNKSCAILKGIQTRRDKKK